MLDRETRAEIADMYYHEMRLHLASKERLPGDDPAPCQEPAEMLLLEMRTSAFLEQSKMLKRRHRELLKLEKRNQWELRTCLARPTEDTLEKVSEYRHRAVLIQQALRGVAEAVIKNNALMKKGLSDPFTLLETGTPDGLVEDEATIRKRIRDRERLRHLRLVEPTNEAA